MGHTCPECGVMCYCGGDIDDLMLDNTPEQDACVHCPMDGLGDDSYPDEGPEDWED